MSIQNLVFEEIQAPDEVKEVLQLPRNQRQVYLQKKLLLLDGVPVAVDISYILLKYGKQLATELQNRMTFPTLEQNGILLDRIEATLECTHASQALAESLQVPLGTPLLLYCYTAYTHDNRPIVCGKAPSRGDRLTYSVVLSNRHA